MWGIYIYIYSLHLQFFNVTFLSQGHVKVKQIQQNVYTVMYHRYVKCEKIIVTVIKISQ